MLPPATLLLVTAALYPALTRVSDSITAARIVIVAYIVLWTCGMLFVGWAIIQRYKRDPQPIENESRVLVGNCLLQMLALAVLFTSTGGFDHLFDFGIVIISLISIFYFFDAAAYLHREYGDSSIAGWIPFIALPATFFLAHDYVSGTYTRVATVAFVVLAPTLIIIQQTQTRIVEKHAPLDDYKPDDSPHPDDEV